MMFATLSAIDEDEAFLHAGLAHGVGDLRRDVDEGHFARDC